MQECSSPPKKRRPSPDDHQQILEQLAPPSTDASIQHGQSFKDTKQLGVQSKGPLAVNRDAGCAFATAGFASGQAEKLGVPAEGPGAQQPLGMQDVFQTGSGKPVTVSKLGAAKAAAIFANLSPIKEDAHTEIDASTRPLPAWQEQRNPPAGPEAQSEYKASSAPIQNTLAASSTGPAGQRSETGWQSHTAAGESSISFAAAQQGAISVSAEGTTKEAVFRGDAVSAIREHPQMTHLTGWLLCG